MTERYEQPDGSVRPRRPRPGVRAEPRNLELERRRFRPVRPESLTAPLRESVAVAGRGINPRREAPPPLEPVHDDDFGYEDDDVRGVSRREPIEQPAEGPTGLSVNAKAVIPVPHTILQEGSWLRELYYLTFDAEPEGLDYGEIRQALEVHWLDLWKNENFERLREYGRLLERFLDSEDQAEALHLSMFGSDLEFLAAAVQHMIDLLRAAQVNPRKVILTLADWLEAGNVASLLQVLRGDVLLGPRPSEPGAKIETKPIKRAPAKRGRGQRGPDKKPRKKRSKKSLSAKK